MVWCVWPGSGVWCVVCVLSVWHTPVKSMLSSSFDRDMESVLPESSWSLRLRAFCREESAYTLQSRAESDRHAWVEGGMREENKGG